MVVGDLLSCLDKARFPMLRSQTNGVSVWLNWHLRTCAFDVIKSKWNEETRKIMQLRKREYTAGNLATTSIPSKNSIQIKSSYSVNDWPCYITGNQSHRWCIASPIVALGVTTQSVVANKTQRKNNESLILRARPVPFFLRWSVRKRNRRAGRETNQKLNKKTKKNKCRSAATSCWRDSSS